MRTPDGKVLRMFCQMVEHAERLDKDPRSSLEKFIPVENRIFGMLLFARLDGCDMKPFELAIECLMSDDLAVLFLRAISVIDDDIAQWERAIEEKGEDDA